MVGRTMSPAQEISSSLPDRFQSALRRRPRWRLRLLVPAATVLVWRPTLLRRRLEVWGSST